MNYHLTMPQKWNTKYHIRSGGLNNVLDKYEIISQRVWFSHIDMPKTMFWVYYPMNGKTTSLRSRYRLSSNADRTMFSQRLSNTNLCDEVCQNMLTRIQVKIDLERSRTT